MQQRRHNRLRIQLPVRADFRDRDRMHDIRLAALAILPEMRFVAEMEGRLDFLDLFRSDVARERVRQIRDGNDVVAAGLFRRGGRAEQMAKRLLEHRIDVLARRVRLVGIGDRFVIDFDVGIGGSGDGQRLWTRDCLRGRVTRKSSVTQLLNVISG